MATLRRYCRASRGDKAFAPTGVSFEYYRLTATSFFPASGPVGGGSRVRVALIIIKNQMIN